MIRPLRSAHLTTFAALALVLPALFLAGLSVRRPVPVSASSESPLVGKQFDLVGKDYHFRFILSSSQLQLTAPTFALHPDVLVYWAPDVASFPQNSRLIGPARIGVRLDVPAGGALVFYSLGHQKVVTSVRIAGAS